MAEVVVSTQPQKGRRAAREAGHGIWGAKRTDRCAGLLSLISVYPPSATHSHLESRGP